MFVGSNRRRWFIACSKIQTASDHSRYGSARNQWDIQVLLELKANPSVRHIPVHIISANERSLEPIKEGAIEYLMKPVDKKDLEEAFNRIENFVSRKMKNLLIIEDDENSRKAMRKLIGNGDVKCFEAGTGKDALQCVSAKSY